MGVFDGVVDQVVLVFGNKEARLRTHCRRIKNKDAQFEDRQASARWLAEQGSPEAVLGLLGRFEMNYEHQMKDSQEKAEVAEHLRGLGESALAPLEQWLMRTAQFARGFGVYQELAGPDRAREQLLRMLAAEGRRGELKPAKKLQLLVKLAEFRGDDVREAVLPFVADYDEGCRYAALEVVLAQDDAPAVREALLQALANPKEESSRVLHRLASAAAHRGWPLGQAAAQVSLRLPPGFRVAGDVVVAG